MPTQQQWEQGLRDNFSLYYANIGVSVLRESREGCLFSVFDRTKPHHHLTFGFSSTAPDEIRLIGTLPSEICGVTIPKIATLATLAFDELPEAAKKLGGGEEARS